MRALRYAFDEALASMWRGRSSGILSTVTIALALFVLGGFLLVTSNLERLVDVWSNAAEISVYLTDEAPAADREAIERALSANPAVVGREYVSKDDALKRFKQSFGELSGALDIAGDNPLPASYEVRVNTRSGGRESLQDLAAKLRQMRSVADVRFDAQWLDRAVAAIAVIRRVGLALGLLLAAAAALTVANVVRLALHARREELDIMQLVGAPQLYIRGPFVMEGILQGGAGAVLALAALLVGHFVIRARYLAALAATIDVGPVRFLSLELCLLLIVGGMLVGCAGGLVAAWNRGFTGP